MELIGFKLDGIFSNCPIYWQNFINKSQTYPYEDLSVTQVNSLLKPFNARYRLEGVYNNPYVEFKNQSDLTFFILKFS